MNKLTSAMVSTQNEQQKRSTVLMLRQKRETVGRWTESKTDRQRLKQMDSNQSR